MRIDERPYDDIVILDLRGKITLGEGDELLQRTVKRLLENGCRKFVLNLEGVPFIDSSGTGELARTYTKISRTGGSLVLLHPTKRIVDLLSIQRALSLFSIFWSERDALAALRAPQFLELTCPVCGSGGIMCGLGSIHSGHTCTACRTTFRVPMGLPPDSGETIACPISRIQLPTYENDTVNVDFGRYATIWLPLRFDLFAFEMVLKGWNVVPTPRRVMFRTWHVREFSDLAMARLADLCDTATSSERVVIHLSDRANADLKAKLRGRVHVVEDWDQAERAFEEGGPGRPVCVSVRRCDSRG
jgi:stage II sporulation protein AA (anti-sigma F factor antagonist)